MKKKYVLGLTFFCFFAAPYTIAIEEESLYELDPFDALVDIDPDQYAQQLRENGSCPEPQDIVQFLVDAGAVEALKSDIYCATFPPNVRSIHRLPSTQLYFDRSYDWAFGFNFFYNQMLKVYFTAHSPFICSYLNIANPDFIEKVDFQDLNDIIPVVLPLFTKIKLQERRAGAMFGWQKKHKSIAFTFVLPLYWLEHNFFLDEDEIEAIQNEPLFQGAGAGNTEKDVTAFFLKHLVATKFGLGDLKLRFEWLVGQTDCSEVALGLQAIFPTAAAIDGRRARLWWGNELLFGGCFCKKCPPPPFNFKTLFDLALCDQNDKQAVQAAKDYAVNFLVGALDKLSANLADQPLGQQHVSFGPILSFTHQFSSHGSILGQGILEYFFPQKETRFFLVKTSPLAFVRNYTDKAQADANLAFFDEQFKNTLYPAVTDILVCPGINAEFYIAAAYDRHNLHAEVGYDFWFQGKEHLRPTTCQKETLEIRQGVKPWCYQNKLFMKVIGNCHNWHLGLNIDTTFTSRGIGKDLTIAVNYTMDY